MSNTRLHPSWRLGIRLCGVLILGAAGLAAAPGGLRAAAKRGEDRSAVLPASVPALERSTLALATTATDPRRGAAPGSERARATRATPTATDRAATSSAVPKTPSAELSRTKPAETVPTPLWLSPEDRRVQALVYPPRDASTPRPLTVMLHGMCDEPQSECPHFADAVTKRGWLVCPRADSRCESGGYIWQHGRRERTVEAAVELVKTEFGTQVSDAEGRTLIGFSLGAIFGMDLAHQGEGRYPRVLLIGAKITPQTSLLQKAGVQRLILAAGDYDMMQGHMRTQARRIKALPTQFFSLGPIGHAFPNDFGQRIESMLSWFETEPAS